jgi:hypothetical protein
VDEIDMSKYVYLLSHYSEHGSENVKATLDRDKLPTLLDRLLAEMGWGGAADEYLAGLRRLLTQTDVDLAADPLPNDLTDGWGGIQLHVVEVDHG